MAIAFHISPSADILWNVLPYPSTDFPLYYQQQKRDLKHYERGVSRHLFPTHLARTCNPYRKQLEFITEGQSTETFHAFMTFLIVLPTPSLHIKMVT